VLEAGTGSLAKGPPIPHSITQDYKAGVWELEASKEGLVTVFPAVAQYFWALKAGRRWR